MNIIYVHRTQGKWAEGVHIRAIAEGLRHAGHAVDIVSPPGIEFENNRSVGMSTQKPASGIHVLWCIISRYTPQIVFELCELLYNIYAVSTINRRLMKKNCDAIYERYAFFCFAGAKVSRQRHIPLFLEVNEISGIERQRGQVLKRLTQHIEKKVFLQAQAIFTVSNYLKAEIVKRGVPAEKIHVIPNAIDEDFFLANTVVPEQSDRKDEIVITFIGHFSRWDRLDFLLKSFAELNKGEPVVRLCMVGYGENLEELKKYAANLGIMNRVTFTGKVAHSNITKLIAQSDICVLPHSNPFGSPMVLFEYMAMGKSVVAPALGPVLDVVEDGKTAVLFQPEDGVDFVAKLSGLVRDPKQRKTIGAAARECIYSKHLWKHNVQRILKVMSNNV